MKHAKNSKKGFTLIELSIVLVIIGLIVGGVLVGQDLIKAAEIRATVSQIEQFNAASNTFRAKYNGIPGDLKTPANFFSSAVGSGDNGMADGDGLVETISATTPTLCTTLCVSGEGALFWYELAQAGLVSNAPTVVTAANIVMTTTEVAATLPAAKMGKGARIAVQASGIKNYFVIATPPAATLVAGTGTFTPGMSPNDAYQFDSKIDDGAPATGIVRSTAIAAPVILPTNAATGNGALTASYGATTCYDSTTTAGVYGTATINSNDNSKLTVCSLSIQAQF